MLRYVKFEKKHDQLKKLHFVDEY